MGKLVVLNDVVLISYLHHGGVFACKMDGTYHPDKQVFSYQRRNEDGTACGAMLHIAIGPLRGLITMNPKRFIRRLYGVPAEQAAFITKHMGIERERLDRMSAADTEEPGIILLWDDGQESIIDGNHRFVKRWQLGKPDMWFTVVTEEQIKPCLLDFPDELAPIEANAESQK